MNFSSILFKRKRSDIPEQPIPPPENETFHLDLTLNMEELNKRLSLSPDLVIRRLKIKHSGRPAALVFMNGLTDKNAINNNILQPLLNETEPFDFENGELPVTIGLVKQLTQWSEFEKAIFRGNSVLFVDGFIHAFAFDTQGWPQRAIEDPQLESSLKGTHQGFVESSGPNIALIRRMLPNRTLKVKEMMVGQRGNTLISLVYLEDLAHPEVMQELEDRINLLNIDSITTTGELVEWIEDNPYSPFPQLMTTERPDSTVNQINQGRIAVIIDGCPNVIITPTSFVSFFQNIDDYGSRWMVASFLRLLRFFAFFIALFLPAFYISLISYNYDLLPIKLLLTIGESRAGVPFPPLIEALMMEITLELMREAGVRLPAPVGQTVGIVGGIIIGQTAVQAGIVSNIMVVVVAFTAICSFIIPSHDMGAAIRLIRFPLMFISFMFGIVGMVIGLMVIMEHLVSLESLGTPYGSPFGPVRFSDWKDSFVRLPVWKMNKRPLSARPIQLKRQGKSRFKGDGN